MRAALTRMLMVVVCASSLVGRAHAQERDPAAAEALFGEAMELMKAKHYAEACPKLAESQRLDPGIGTQFRLATCYEYQGKLASAWANFLEVASLATASGQHERARAATRRATLLEPRLPRLRIMVPAAARTAGLEITRDGVVVGEAQWFLAVPVDPGDHRVEATAPQKRALEATVTAAEGATSSFEVKPLEGVSVEPAVTSAPLPVAPVIAKSAQEPTPALPAAPLSEPATAAHQEAESSRPVALVVGLAVAGVVGIGVGTAFGLMAGSSNSDSKKDCDSQDLSRCGSQGVTLRNRALTQADVSTVTFIVGGAALASAGLLWLLSGGSEPARDKTALRIDAGPSSASVSVHGGF